MELKIAANFSDEIPGPLRLLIHKNYNEIQVIMVTWMHLCYTTHPDQEHEEINKILKYMQNAVKEMATCTEVIRENALKNVASFFVNLYKIGNFNLLPFEFMSMCFDLSFLWEDKSIKPEVSNLFIGIIVLLFEQLNWIESRRKLQQHILKNVQNENWRIRDNAIFLYQITEKTYEYDLNITQDSIDLAIKYIEDENLYVMKRARWMLARTLEYHPERIQEIIDSYKPKAFQIYSKLKLNKNSSDDTKDDVKNLSVYAAILLGMLLIITFIAACYTSEYFICDWVAELSLFLYKLWPFVPKVKNDILRFFDKYKKIHQQLVIFQESKYSPELLENLKEMFSINSNHSIAY